MSSEDFGVLLNLAYGAFKAELHAVMERDGFDDLGSSFGYVFRLLERAPATLRDVAAHLDITPQGALKVVDDMVRKGYLERRDHPDDGRLKLLVLTDRARAAIASARRFHRAFERRLGDRLGAAHGAAARAALEEIVAHAAAAGNLPRPG